MSVRTKLDEHIYVNYGHYDAWRHWSDAQQYSYVSACGYRHVQDLHRLNSGDRIWVYVPGYGYAGVAIVESQALPANKFKVQTTNGLVSILNVIKNKAMAAHHGEHYVSIRWLQTRPLHKAIYATRPIFSSRLVVCQPRIDEWYDTLRMLKNEFPAWNN